MNNDTSVSYLPKFELDYFLKLEIFLKQILLGGAHQTLKDCETLPQIHKQNEWQEIDFALRS